MRIVQGSVPLALSYDEVGHEHNSWEVVRVKKEKTTVRCRECQYQVKMKHVRRCEEFAEKGTCKKGRRCSDMHVHQVKMTLEERVRKYGLSVLDFVPPGMRVSDILKSCAEGNTDALLLGSWSTNIPVRHMELWSPISPEYPSFAFLYNWWKTPDSARKPDTSTRPG
eukprot:TRINITY_DN249_c3_g1_i1.p1 TRINITY_DN249_c3_g1~~TRINITY_DN249_c3_g1_i1.p1  ORF type:complete len:167 (+),score=23.84 TRINITY_DN249_c3_g1_i1:42-542(+)